MRKSKEERQLGSHTLGLLGLVFVLAVKSIVLSQLSDHVLLKPNGSPDSNVYVNLATSVTSGNWSLAPGLYFVSPLYIYFLASILSVTGSLLVAKVVQIVLGTIAVGLIWGTADQWFGRRAAWWSSILATLTGLFTFYEVTLLQASLDVFLTSAFLAALTFGLRGSRNWLLGIAGIVAGVQTLNRPNVVLAVAVIFLTLLLVRRWRLALLLVVGFSVGIAPVVARNRIVAGEWALATSHGGLNFFMGNSADATGLYRPPPGIRPDIKGQLTDTRRVAEGALGRPLTDAEVSSYFTNLGLSWIRANPTAWLRLMVTKLYYTFHGQHIALPLSYSFFAYDTGSILRFLFVGPWMLLPLGCLGLVACAPRGAWRQYGVWLAFVPAYAASVAIFFVSERYRLPLLVPMAIGAGAALNRLWEQVQGREWTKLIRVGGVVAVLGITMNWPLGWIDGDARLDMRIQMAESLAASGDAAGAERWAERGLSGNAYEVDSRLRIGRAFAEHGDWALATNYFSAADQLERSNPAVTLELVKAWKAQGRPDRASEVLTAQPVTTSDDGEMWLALGRHAMSLRIPTKAEEFFARALALVPSSTAAREELGLALLLNGKLEAAANELSDVVRRSPANADAWAHLALANLRLGRLAEAARCADAALARKPGHELAGQIRRSIPGK